MDSMLLQVPRGNRADWAGFAEAPMWSAAATTGGEFPSLQNKDIKLVLGYDGVSLVSPRGALTVLYRECVLMQCWPDGARRLIGPEGVSVSIEPNLYDVSAETIAGIDELVPDELKVWQPARSADRIPQRPAAPAAPSPTVRTVLATRTLMQKAMLVVVGALALFCLLVALASTLDMLLSPEDSSPSGWLGSLLFWWLGLIFAYLIVSGLRRLRGTAKRR
jgi:hypothetical protein